MDALVTATSRNAEALGLGKEIGSITPGYQADMIALEGNPLERSRRCASAFRDEGAKSSAQRPSANERAVMIVVAGYPLPTSGSRICAASPSRRSRPFARP
jgi:cytosine/adenosine deaminase-related metal-dependent hydrolase